MNYYEELGLRHDASADQIRQAYRGLARLLHPDQQPDEGLRRLAEGQMRRLNALHDVLVEPARRREYDRALGRSLALTPTTAACRAPRALPFTFRDAGLLAAGFALASLYWQVPSSPDRRTRPLVEGVSTASGISAGESGPAPTAGRPALVKRKRMQASIAASQATPRAAIHDPPPPAGVDLAGWADGIEAAALPQFEPAPDPALASVQAVVAGMLPRFGGTWVYVRPKLLPAERSLYPADYVETVISEDGQTVRGRYRARYDVADRPISSEVAFRFEGTAEESGASLRWTGAGGAEGEAKLVLLSRNSMRVEWVATNLGTQLGLASGTAILTRRQGR
jgi:hypothetical protein